MRSWRWPTGSARADPLGTVPSPPAGCHALGSDDDWWERSGVGPKAALLHRARRNGLAVPHGFVVPDRTPTPEGAAIEAWLVDAGSPTIAVRSAFATEDGSTASLAGWFDTKLRVDAAGFSDALEAVRASAAARAGSFRRDVLVMSMVDASRSGVAFSEPGTYDDRINATHGTAELLVGGQRPGDALWLPRIETAPAGWQRRLQSLLADVRREFGDEPWDLEWADDGSICHLVQLRSITVSASRNEALTIANHAEILPHLPSALMTSVIAEAGPELFAWYRRFDRTLPADRPFLEVVAGRPFINLSLLEDLLRHLGLPTALVADSIGGPPERDVPANPRRIVAKLGVLLRMGLAQVAAVARVDAKGRELAAIAQPQATSFGEAIDRLRAAHVGLVTGMFPLSSAIGPPLSLLRRAGTLTEHAGSHRTITTEMADALDGVSVGAAELPAFLERFGHRGVYESDIARPRFRDHPGSLVAAGEVRSPGAAPSESVSSPSRSRGPAGSGWRWWATRPLWWLVRAPIDARERLRHEAMRGFADLRDQLWSLAVAATDRGQLREPGDLWLLDSAEVRRLDAGWVPDAGFWAGREAERNRLAELEPPAVVHRFDDPADWSPTAAGRVPSTGPEPGRLCGLSLTAGTVDGVAWVLREPSLACPVVGEDRIVLVARSIDAGWIPTLGLVDAVVVETGGDLSHGSILVRERGLPAITNVRGALGAIADGDRLTVRAGDGSITIDRSVRVAPEEGECRDAH